MLQSTQRPTPSAADPSPRAQATSRGEKSAEMGTSDVRKYHIGQRLYGKGDGKQEGWHIIDIKQLPTKSQPNAGKMVICEKMTAGAGGAGGAAGGGSSGGGAGAGGGAAVKMKTGNPMKYSVGQQIFNVANGQHEGWYVVEITHNADGTGVLRLSDSMAAQGEEAEVTQMGREPGELTVNMEPEDLRALIMDESNFEF
jgi:hypothetical protein